MVLRVQARLGPPTHQPSPQELRQCSITGKSLSQVPRQDPGQALWLLLASLSPTVKQETKWNLPHTVVVGTKVY